MGLDENWLAFYSTGAGWGHGVCVALIQTELKKQDGEKEKAKDREREMVAMERKVIQNLEWLQQRREVQMEEEF